MNELGRIANSVYGGAEGTYPAQYGLSDSIKARPSIRTADAAAEATIRNAHRAEISNARENIGNADPTATRAEMMSDFIAAVKEKVAAMNELFEQIADGRFSHKNLAESLQEQAEAIGSGSDALWGDVWAALWQAQSDSASPFSDSKDSTSGIDEISDVEKNIAEQNAQSELGMFSLARVREKALRALRCQEDLEPEKVLSLLKDEVTKGSAGAAAH